MRTVGVGTDENRSIQGEGARRKDRNGQKFEAFTGKGRTVRLWMDKNPKYSLGRDEP